MDQTPSTYNAVLNLEAKRSEKRTIDVRSPGSNLEASSLLAFLASGEVPRKGLKSNIMINAKYQATDADRDCLRALSWGDCMSETTKPMLGDVQIRN